MKSETKISLSSIKYFNNSSGQWSQKRCNYFLESQKYKIRTFINKPRMVFPKGQMYLSYGVTSRRREVALNRSKATSNFNIGKKVFCEENNINNRALMYRCIMYQLIYQIYWQIYLYMSCTHIMTWCERIMMYSRPHTIKGNVMMPLKTAQKE